MHSTDLTPAGEQLVIPGCERQATEAKPQLDLFSVPPSTADRWEVEDLHLPIDGTFCTL